MRRYISYLLVLCFLFGITSSCSDDWLIDQPDSFWELLEGEWRVDSEYSINGEVFLTEASDRFTILKFDSIPKSDLNRKLPGNSIFLEDFVEVNNTGYEEQFLNFGSILGKRHELPVDLDLSIEVGDCFNCRFLDIQSEDIIQCQTDTMPFQVTYLDEESMVIQFVSNIYNRQFNGETILDTLLLTFGRDVDNFSVGAGFNIEGLPREDWYRDIFGDDCGQINNLKSCNSDLDGIAMCFEDAASALCINNDLFSSIEDDGELTISFWINPISVTKPKQILYSKYRNSAGPFIFSLENNRVVVEINNLDRNIHRTISTGTIRANEWTHLTFSYLNEELLICINGEIDQKFDVVNSWLYDADAAVYFGNSEYALDNNLNQGFEGMMDEIIFFERYLNQGVIRQLYLWHLNN
jgi:hypothetical protein